MVLTGCNKNDDYSKYSFTDVRWTRYTEFISFSSDGFFSYSCVCSNPVNDSDICENYTYDDKTKEIKLKYLEEMNGTITTIKIVDYTETTLELDFAGEIRKFKIEE